MKEENHHEEPLPSIQEVEEVTQESSSVTKKVGLSIKRNSQDDASEEKTQTPITQKDSEDNTQSNLENIEHSLDQIEEKENHKSEVKIQAPKTEEPKTEEPKIEETKIEETKTEETKIEKPKTEETERKKVVL
jgi:hypothetical protein